MTKKQLINAIISMEYTEQELANDKGLYKARYNSLLNYSKQFLEDRVQWLQAK